RGCRRAQRFRAAPAGIPALRGKPRRRRQRPARMLREVEGTSVATSNDAGDPASATCKVTSPAIGAVSQTNENEYSVPQSSVGSTATGGWLSPTPGIEVSVFQVTSPSPMLKRQFALGFGSPVRIRGA